MIDLSNESSDVITDWIETLAVIQKGRPLGIQKVEETSFNLANVTTNRIPFSFNQLKKKS